MFNFMKKMKHQVYFLGAETQHFAGHFAVNVYRPKMETKRDTRLSIPKL